MPSKKKSKKDLKKSEIEWKPDKSQILIIEESVKMSKKEKGEKK